MLQLKQLKMIQSTQPHRILLCLSKYVTEMKLMKACLFEKFIMQVNPCVIQTAWI